MHTVIHNMKTQSLGPGLHVEVLQSRIEMYGSPEDGGYSGSLQYFAPTHGELEPCPFCGSLLLAVENTHTPSYWVECRECHCEMGGDCPDSYKLDTPEEFQRVHSDGIKSCVEFWNQRAALFQKHDRTTITIVPQGDGTRGHSIFVNGLKAPVLLGTVHEIRPLAETGWWGWIVCPSDTNERVAELEGSNETQNAIDALISWHNERVDEARRSQLAEEVQS